MEDCVLCRIVKGTTPASIVYSDERIMAFLDIQPINPGHVLVIPKAHAARLSDLDKETGAHMFETAMHVAAALERSEVRLEGVNLFLADGEAAGQDIFHVHLHVIPRFKGDGFRIDCGPGYGLKPDRRELEMVASKIREALR